MGNGCGTEQCSVLRGLQVFRERCYESARGGGMKYPVVNNYVGGRFVEFAGERVAVVSPLDGSAISEVPRSGAAEVALAVEAAKSAFAEWSRRTLRQRAGVMYAYRELLVRHTAE